MLTYSKTNLIIGVYLLVITTDSAIGAQNTPPKFKSEDLDDSQSEIVVRVKEGESSLNKQIYHLFGEDSDGDQLKFGVLGTIGEDLLRIEAVPPNEAKVYLKKELDREIQDSYTLVLTLTDGKLGKGNYITKSLLLIVEDINDNTPVFRPYRTSLTLSETSRPGIIETVEAFDSDEGRFGQVLYHLLDIENEESSTPSNTFSIETVEGKGVISLIGSLDYERKSIYQLRVMATDRAVEGDRRTATAAIVIQVEDAEDEPPVFTFVPSVTRIAEDLPIGAPILRVTAVDGDRGVNNAVTYRIIRGDRGLFAINQNSGLVTVFGRLDRESAINSDDGSAGAYILEIEATEVTVAVFPPPIVTTEVTIILTDVNDEIPKFRAKQYTAEIAENAPNDMPVTFVGDSVPQVFDLDQGNNGSFALTIEYENKTFEDVFYVTPNQGINEASLMLRVRDSLRLDYEKINTIRLKLIAKEKTSNSNARYSSAQVTINIKDVNDNIPQFDRDLYYGSVPENALKGTTVAIISATDIDSGIYGTVGIRYTDIRGEMASTLKLDPISGVITVKRSDHNFDRELSAQHFLTVEARDANGSGNRNTVQLILNITDVNDCPPKFFHDKYEARIYENNNDFDQPIRITASDEDMTGTPNSEIRYLIMTNDNNEYSFNFTIDDISGRLRVKNPLDFELIPGPKSDSRNISLTIRAIDLGEPRLHSDTHLIVHIYDVNDWSPVFTQTIYTKSIPEDIRDGSMVLQVSALDGDHSPANSRVYYRIVSGALDKFIIDANTGVISVATGANLDPDRSFPKKTWYLMEVMALDSSFGAEQRSSTAAVNITIVDVNNKAPEFVDNPIAVVPEDAPNQFFVTRVSATDLDDKPVLRFSIDYTKSEARNEFGATVDHNLFVDSFSINPLDGTIRVVKILDREVWDQIKLYLIVEDIAATNKGQKAKTMLTIRVSDVNDNRPQFVQQLYRGVITENAIAGTPILTVNADDADTNKTVSYSLEGRHELIQLIKINPKTGEVSVSERIDRERHSWINVTVRASDSGKPSLTGQAFLSIQVLDENDNNPVFVGDQRQSLTIAEDAPIGSLVAQVSARDEDSGVFGKVTYLLDSSSSLGKFKIDRESGSIVVAGVLNREEVSQYKLLVQAWDNYEYGFTTGESRKAFKTITVTITDVNDETPTIIPQLGDCAIINEFHPIRDMITYVNAIDADDANTPNGRVSFGIIEGNLDRLFDLEPSPPNGAKLVSRFSVRGRVGNYSLTIKATDGGSPSKSSTSKVRICVIDVNDHNPVFVKPPSNMTIRVAENATIGSQVVDVLAVDEDSGVNALVRYKLRQLPNNHWKSFAINEVSGVITLAKQLDRESQRVHELRVQAFDLGEPTSLSTDLDLTVLVTNVDDFEPEFTQDVFQVVFTENTLPEIEKYKLLPTIDKDDYDLNDPAVGFKTIPCYYIVGGDGGDRFHLNTFTHELTTTVSLDREEKDNYTLIVQATNDCFKVPPKVTKFDQKDNSLLQVLIGVRDVNDNSPKMVEKVFTGGFTTDVDFGTVFMEIKAIDSDIGANSVVNYYIISEVKQSLTEGLDTISSEPFIISRITGEISLNFDPQKDMKGYFEFDVLANDTDGLADSAKVYIYLLRDDQRVRFVLRLTPQELREKLDKFRDVLANITGATVNIDSYKFHENRDGSVDKKKTDLYLHFVNRDDNSIIEVMNVLSLIDKNIEYLDELYKEFNVLVSEPTQTSEYFLEWEDQLKACLLGTTAFLALLLVLVTCLCLNQKSRYERQLKAATAPVFGSETQLTRCNVPNTNQHAIEGSNPMWMTGYDNQWYKDEEQISNDSTGGNSLDENAITETHSPNNSLNSSADHESGGSNSTTTNERSALCRGLAVGRVTPQNITLPNSNGHHLSISHNSNQLETNVSHNCHNIKKCAPKPPTKPSIGKQVIHLSRNVVQTGDQSRHVSTHNRLNSNANHSINNVYIETYSNHNKHNSHHNSSQILNHNNNNTLNQLSLMNLETTEL